MTTQNASEHRDAFKDVMAAARQEPGRAELAHQSPGRPISNSERALAEALMQIYATGQKGAAAVAEDLSKRGVTAPISGRKNWDAALLEDELKAINASYDAAYADAGIGA